MEGFYSERRAYEAYIEYLALKRHFSSNYDYFKYNGKVNAKPESLLKNRDKFQFYKLSNMDDFKDVILANIVNDTSVYIRDIASESGKRVYFEWRKRNDSLPYTFKSDILKLQDPFKSNLKVLNGQHPHLLKMYLRSEISIETLMILLDICGIKNNWSEKITDSVVFPAINTLVENYTPFLYYDRNKMRKIVFDLNKN